MRTEIAVFVLNLSDIIFLRTARHRLATGAAFTAKAQGPMVQSSGDRRCRPLVNRDTPKRVQNGF